MPHATMVLVVGRPASGKTTLSRRIAAEFDLPLLSKDAVKEILFDRLGTGDRESSMRLGRAAFAVLAHEIEQMLQGRCSFVVEAPFVPEHEEERFREWQRRSGVDALQIHCVAPPDELVRRFAQRAGDGSRHPGHDDALWVEEFRATLQDGRRETLDLDGALHLFQSDQPGAMERLLADLRPALAP